MEKLVEKQPKLLEEATRRHVLDAVVRVTQKGVFREMNTLAMAKILFVCMVGSLVAQPVLGEFSPEQVSNELMRLFAP